MSLTRYRSGDDDIYNTLGLALDVVTKDARKESYFELFFGTNYEDQAKKFDLFGNARFLRG